MVMERKPRERRTVNRHSASYECPICAACGYAPNAATIEAIRESHENKNLKSQTLAEFLAELYS